jgi:hypothetical protein
LLRRRRRPCGIFGAFRRHAGSALGNLERWAEKDRKKKVEKTIRKKKFEQQSKTKSRILPIRGRHLSPLVMPLRGPLLALGGRSLAGAGFRRRSLFLLVLGAKLLQELLADLGLQRNHVFVDLRVGAG